MQFTENEIQETIHLSSIFIKLNNPEPKYFEFILDDLNIHQPFILSVILGFHPDLKPKDFDEVFKLFVLIWEYFRLKKNSKKVKISEKLFTDTQQNIINYFLYLEKEDSKVQKKAIDQDINHFKCRALMSAILGTFATSPIF